MYEIDEALRLLPSPAAFAELIAIDEGTER